MHTFDIHIPNVLTAKESEKIQPGSKFTVLDTRFGKFGFGICYDLRFALHAMVLRNLGAQVLFYPAQFTLVTGESYFQNLGITRALDTQCYVI